MRARLTFCYQSARRLVRRAFCMGRLWRVEVTGLQVHGKPFVAIFVDEPSCHVLRASFVGSRLRALVLVGKESMRKGRV